MLMSESRSLAAVSPPADIPNYLARSLALAHTLTPGNLGPNCRSLSLLGSSFAAQVSWAVFCPGAGALVGRPGGGGHGGSGAGVVGNRARMKLPKI